MGFIHIIFLSSTWELNHRKGLHRELNKRFNHWSEVLFIEAPYSIIIHTALYLKNKSFKNSKNKDKKDLNLFRPLILFHNKIWSRYPITIHIDSWLVSIQLKRHLKKYFEESKFIFWANSPFDFPIIERFMSYFLIYDYYDNFGFSEDGTVNLVKSKFNKKIIKKSNLVFCTSRVMYDLAIAMNTNSFYVQNGYTWFPKNDKKMNLGLEGRVIGYLGNIRNWIDFDLLRDLLKNLKKNEHLIFIGPVEKNVTKNVEELKKNSQFRHFKKVDSKDIFEYIKAFHIGIIPFKKNNFTQGVLPYKFFEYIACDINIVSTSLNDFLQFKDIINVASDNSDFIRMCLSSLEQLNKNEQAYERIRTESTWDQRAMFMEKKIQGILLK